MAPQLEQLRRRAYVNITNTTNRRRKRCGILDKYETAKAPKTVPEIIFREGVCAVNWSISLLRFQHAFFGSQRQNQRKQLVI